MQAWLKLVELAQTQIEIITQWGIYNKPGSGAKFYDRLSQGESLFCLFGLHEALVTLIAAVSLVALLAVEDKGVALKLAYNPRVDNATRRTPADLRRAHPDLVQERLVDIWGKINPDTGVIHSKMILTDR